ncbi:MAG: corrinoid protein [Anaerolineae bacterium]|nr:corrinoid protein [Anaerolineae bacterium]
MDKTLESILEAVVNGDRKAAADGVQQALDAGIAPETILNQGLIDAMTEVGKRFQCGDYFVPEMLIAARAMKDGLAVLKPHMAQHTVKSAGKVAIGTVKGDLHDVGKNLVAMMLEGGGFEVKDLGVDVPPETFIEAIQRDNVDIIALSALITTTMTSMKQTIEALQAAGVRNQVKVIVGGAPVTEAFAHSIGADAYSPDASQAVSAAKALLGA